MEQFFLKTLFQSLLCLLIIVPSEAILFPGTVFSENFVPPLNILLHSRLCLIVPSEAEISDMS